MATQTTNLNLFKPAVNSATDEDLWGTQLKQLNTNMDTIDSEAVLKTVATNYADLVQTRPIFKDYGETAITEASSTTITIDLVDGNHVFTTLAHNTTLTLSNPSPTGNRCFVTWEITQDGTGSRLVTWPASVKWNAGSAPTLTTTAGGVDIITLTTRDAGTTWYGGIFGQAFA